jgi:precorrin-6Y C5,15-methyltransferase (decarboxylating)
MEANSQRFGTPGIRLHTGDFCRMDLSHLEAPEAAFVGGHGGQLDEMAAILKGKLSNDGVIVFNSVSDESRKRFHEAVEAAGMHVDNETRVMIDTHNTITICRAAMRNDNVKTENIDENNRYNSNFGD